MCFSGVPKKFFTFQHFSSVGKVAIWMWHPLPISHHLPNFQEFIANSICRTLYRIFTYHQLYSNFHGRFACDWWVGEYALSRVYMQ